MPSYSQAAFHRSWTLKNTLFTAVSSPAQTLSLVSSSNRRHHGEVDSDNRHLPRLLYRSWTAQPRSTRATDCSPGTLLPLLDSCISLHSRYRIAITTSLPLLDRPKLGPPAVPKANSTRLPLLDRHNSVQWRYRLLSQHSPTAPRPLSLAPLAVPTASSTSFTAPRPPYLGPLAVPTAGKSILCRSWTLSSRSSRGTDCPYPFDTAPGPPTTRSNAVSLPAQTLSLSCPALTGGTSGRWTALTAIYTDFSTTHGLAKFRPPAVPTAMSTRLSLLDHPNSVQSRSRPIPRTASAPTAPASHLLSKVKPVFPASFQPFHTVLDLPKSVRGR